MSQNGRDAYLEGRILSADPLELVRMLYQGASDAVRLARRCLAEGDIAGRSRAISNAYDILAELLGSLDWSCGEISHRLAHLYDYMQRRLLEANLQQIDAPLAEVLSLVATLAEGWEAAQPESPAPQPAPSVWPSMPPAELEPVTRAWSV